MKFLKFISFGAIALLLIASIGCDTDTTIEPETIVEISDSDLEGLKFMREEEKLARDVYISLFEMYDNQVFNNISNSEQSHMDNMLDLLVYFEAEDPALGDSGKFANEDLQQLYDDLITQGSISEIDALLVGATIEDVDIRDLDLFILETQDEKIIEAYNFLNCGSRNHMRAFVSRLSDLGVTYTPQFISQEQFDSIILGDKEKCGQI